MQIILSFELTIASQEKIICTRYLRYDKKPILFRFLSWYRLKMRKVQNFFLSLGIIDAKRDLPQSLQLS